jgi:hypothetical protein
MAVAQPLRGWVSDCAEPAADKRSTRNSGKTELCSNAEAQRTQRDAEGD